MRSLSEVTKVGRGCFIRVQCSVGQRQKLVLTGLKSKILSPLSRVNLQFYMLPDRPMAGGISRINRLKSALLWRKGISREPCLPYNPMLSGAHTEIEIRLYVEGATKWRAVSKPSELAISVLSQSLTQFWTFHCNRIPCEEIDFQRFQLLCS